VVPEPVAEMEPQGIMDEDHSSIPLVDFGGNDEPVVEPEEEIVEDFDDDIDDEQEEDNQIETTNRPAADPEPQMESELDIKLEPEMEAKMVSSTAKTLEEISDEDIPEWVIEPYVASPVEEATPVQQPVEEPKEEPISSTETPKSNSNLQSILNSFETIKKPEAVAETNSDQVDTVEPEPLTVAAPEPVAAVAPQPVPVVENTEPAFEPEPTITETPVPESAYEVDQEQVDSSETVIEREPAVSQAPELATALEHDESVVAQTSEETQITADEELDSVFENEEETDDDNQLFETEMPRKSGGKWLLSLLACIIGLAGGYILGSYYPYTKFLETESKETVIHVQKETVPESNLQSKQKVETVSNEVQTESQSSVKKEETREQEKAEKSETKDEAQSNTKSVSKEKTDAESKEKSALEKYNTMDVRVRLGAYRIVGTDKVVKVKEGDNLVKISRRYLGSGMECYIEVFNNIKASDELKIGQEIKIPKLEWKKKKKTSNSN